MKTLNGVFIQGPSKTTGRLYPFTVCNTWETELQHFWKTAYKNKKLDILTLQL